MRTRFIEATNGFNWKPLGFGSEREAAAWLAGLYEGEGSVTSRKTHRFGFTAQIALGSTDKDVVEKAQALAQAGKIYGPYDHAGLGKKPRYDWKVSRRHDVRRLLIAMLPFLGSRRGSFARRVITAIDAHVRMCRNGLHPVPYGKCDQCRAASRARKTERQRERRHAS